MELNLTRQRSLPDPERRELAEAPQTCLAQGEPLGRGRAVARAMSACWVGGRRGRLTAQARLGRALDPHVEALLVEVRRRGAEPRAFACPCQRRQMIGESTTRADEQPVKEERYGTRFRESVGTAADHMGG
jgi:Family of unknown function (DUF5682)